MEKFKSLVLFCSALSIIAAILNYVNGENSIYPLACYAVIQYVLLRIMGILK